MEAKNLQHYHGITLEYSRFDMNAGTGASTYAVVAIHEWNREVFEAKLSNLPGSWILIDHKDDLTEERIAEINPHTLFFLHWSWIVPNSITERYRCIVFHMTDVPYGRGGSPLQNLIIRGHEDTVLSAIHMTQSVDAGPVFMKRPLSLHGRAQEIYARSANLAAEMIKEIIADDPQPVTQQGVPVVFKRRTPEQSRLPKSLTPKETYDFIRMLDANGYPRAYIEADGYRLVFAEAELVNDQVTARVEISTPKVSE